MASAILAVAAAAVLKVGLSSDRLPPQPTPGTDHQTTGVMASTPSRGSANGAGPRLGRATPMSLTIPAIGVNAEPLVQLGLDSAGELQVPADFNRPGWYRRGPAPGQAGAAVIAGHVDSPTGPAVFWRLGTLHAGNRINIHRGDGTDLTFTVYAVESYAKDQFPTARVYGSSNHRAELRLITCGGSFDDSTGHYRDNTVAYARLTRAR